MPLREGGHLLCSLKYLDAVILAIAVETAKPTVTLFAASDALTCGDFLAAVWANTPVPEFKEIVLLRFRHRRLGARARSLVPFSFPRGSQATVPLCETGSLRGANTILTCLRLARSPLILPCRRAPPKRQAIVAARLEEE